MTIPSGNGEVRGPESAPGNPGKLPGTRPERAAANNRRNADFLGATPVAAQDGFGTEDMHQDASHLSTANVRPSELCDVPVLASLGDGGQSFGGV
jgi:hypothetical protein